MENDVLVVEVYEAAMRLADAAADYIECTEDRQFVHILRGQECEGECGAALGEALGAFRVAQQDMRDKAQGKLWR